MCQTQAENSTASGKKNNSSTADTDFKKIGLKFLEKDNVEIYSFTKNGEDYNSLCKRWYDKTNIWKSWNTSWPEDDKYQLFKDWFTSRYDVLSCKIQIFKKKNFLLKGIFLILIAFLGIINAAVIGVYLLECYHVPQYHLDALFLLSIEACCLIIGMLLLLPFAKWIDVKKYQETWVRHRTQQRRMDVEMIKFICKVKPYNQDDRNKNCDRFILRILATQNATEDTFLSLMTQKEKGLLDELVQIKGFDIGR